MTKKKKIRHITYWVGDLGNVYTKGCKTLRRYKEILHAPNPYSDDVAGMLRCADEKRAMVRKECDPQEVYFLEYNERECNWCWDGDEEAYQVIVDVWGEDVAKKIKRI